MIGAIACAFYSSSAVAAPTITYVQGNYATPQTPQASVTVTFTSAQTAGDLNVVAVGWNDSAATVSSVTDSERQQLHASRRADGDQWGAVTIHLLRQKYRRCRRWRKYRHG